jgi:hypothetical protein
MMSDRMALKVAINLLLVPSQVRLVRLEPLPDGVVMLLRIAAGDREAEQAASALADRSRETVRHAAAFFIEQILFAPDADSYRILGADPQAGANELRRNLALLMRWLRPDLDPRGERSVFSTRVTGAWNNLKTPARRAAYDEQSRHRAEQQFDRTGRRSRRRGRLGLTSAVRGWHGRNTDRYDGAGQSGFLRRALAILLQWSV